MLNLATHQAHAEGTTYLVCILSKADKGIPSRSLAKSLGCWRGRGCGDPYLAFLLESYLYDPRPPTKAQKEVTEPPAENSAISVCHLNKVFCSSGWNPNVNDLSFDIPKTGIFVILGSNGAGKSTALGILSGLDGQTAGDIIFEGGRRRPRRGTSGIVPQKNVLFSPLYSKHLSTLRKAAASRSFSAL
ncbi:hypothetical protein FA13DRAFT_1813311 [Coprinellus micaceus]|uniref:ABC transporter domain-containing protein n=1 Tax=Coprinellus micaceus TaxID=71717 RepID=A0A4Y7TDV6_COPMI|nr:hypothetical protein FA13DRAFT_1813311 [Coprinellus micaceus]